MSKHPGPWTIDDFGQLLDSKRRVIARTLTLDPETSTVLLHAAEMFAALREMGCKDGDAFDFAFDGCLSLVSKIESEIATAKGKP